MRKEKITVTDFLGVPVEETTLPDQGKKDSILLTNNSSIELSEEVVKSLGIENPSTPLRFVMNGNKLEIQANIHSLAKVYIEPTAKCNLNCKTCVRGTWKEKMGSMDLKTFDTLIDQLRDFRNLQSVMFGGIGEPTLPSGYPLYGETSKIPWDKD